MSFLKDIVDAFHGFLDASDPHVRSTLINDFSDFERRYFFFKSSEDDLFCGLRKSLSRYTGEERTVFLKGAECFSAFFLI